MLVKIPESKKLTGLVIGLIALLLLVVIAVVAMAFFGLGEGLFEQIAAMISGTTVAHQTGQTVIDRAQANKPSSPSYAGNQLAQAPPPPGPRPASPPGPKLTGLD